MKPFQTQGYVFVQARVLALGGVFAHWSKIFFKSFFWSLLTAGVKYFPFLPQENRDYYKRSLVVLLSFLGKMFD